MAATPTPTLPEGLATFTTAYMRALVAATPASTTIVTSPVNVATAMALATSAATLGSANHSEFQALFGLSDGTTDEADNAFVAELTAATSALGAAVAADPELAFSLANSIWGAGAMHETFKSHAAEHFAAAARDDISADAINAWVSDATNGCIPTLFSVLPRDTAAVLVAAIYFKGAWANKFDPALTTDAPFELLDGSTVPCALMSIPAKPKLAYAADPAGAYVVAPYGSGSIASLIGLPADKGSDALDAMFVALSTDSASVAARARPAAVTLRLPRFEADFSADLKDVFAALGLTHAFAGTEWGRMMPGMLAISAIAHKAKLVVNEEGAEAAAATAVVMSRSRPRNIPVHCTRPFVFSVFDTASGLVLFTARITGSDGLVFTPTA